MLPAKIGTKKTVVLLTAGYGAGYLIMGFSGWMLVLMLGFFLVGVAKGSTINTCTILVADNSGDRTKGMNIMHSCYALGALFVPFLHRRGHEGRKCHSHAGVSCLRSPAVADLLCDSRRNKGHEKDRNIDKSFLKSRKFWMLTGLLFCQNAAETSVTGWMVTYFKGNGIISGALSPYTVTVMWGATLIARLLIAFVIPVKNSYSAMIKMGIGCIIFYLGLMMAGTQTAAILLLFAFAFCHGRHESHCRGQRRTYDQRGQHGNYASGCQQRRYHHALDYRHGG